MPHDDAFIKTDYPDVSLSPRVIVVGAGPGGLFAALKLVELGLCPIVLERGKDVRERKKTLQIYLAPILLTLNQTIVRRRRCRSIL